MTGDDSLEVAMKATVPIEALQLAIVLEKYDIKLSS